MKNSQVNISEKEIVETYYSKWFKRPSKDPDFLQWTDNTNEHLISWMKVNPSSKLKKLWGIIHSPFFNGNYTLKISNRIIIKNIIQHFMEYPNQFFFRILLFLGTNKIGCVLNFLFLDCSSFLLLFMF